MSAEGRCARHPDVVAQRTCTRCGDYFCEACRDAEHDGVCTRCAERLPHGIAWEDPRAGVWPVRFLLTLRDVAWRPSIAFPGPARPLPALGFAALCGALFGLMLLAFGLSLLGSSTQLEIGFRTVDETTLLVALAFGVVLFTGGAVVLSIVQSASFALGLRMVGRSRGLLRFATRASGYAQGLALLFIAPPWLLAIVSALVDPSATLEQVRLATWLAVSLLWPVASGRVWFAAARGLGLSSARAGLASLGPLMLCTLPAAYVSHLQLTL